MDIFDELNVLGYKKYDRGEKNNNLENLKNIFSILPL